MTQTERQAKNQVDAAIEQLGAAVEEIMASHKPATLDEAKEAERQMIDAMYSAVLGATPAMNNEQEYQKHIANKGSGQSNDHPDGCFYCGSSLHHSGDCPEREELQHDFNEESTEHRYGRS